MPEFIKLMVNALLGPVTFFVLSIVGFTAMIALRGVWTRGPLAVAVLLVTTGCFYLSLADPNFHLIVSKPDNVAISILFLMLGFFLWVAFRKMARNDALVATGQPTCEARESKQKVFCWPDLLYSEFLCLILVVILLLLWSYWLKAPLEQPGHGTRTPNPSKAPWYFVGLQEMLVYFDPWLAGVVFPILIILGLMAVPYLDKNPQGNGYYTFRERPFAITVFLFGFIVLWILLIALGTFFRGPNWEFFSPFERWDVHRAGVHTNVTLSDAIYVYGLGRPAPSNIFVRELPGLLLLFSYFALIPPLLSRTVFKRLRQQMGFARFYTMTFLLISMAALPLKMVLRWMFNLKYIVAIPEWFFNI